MNLIEQANRYLVEETDLSVANEIKRQIGNRALMMMGAYGFSGDEYSLTFRIRGAPIVKIIKIYLNGKDLYDISFYNNRGREVKKVEDIYVDMMHEIIEKNTGLYTSL